MGNKKKRPKPKVANYFPMPGGIPPMFPPPTLHTTMCQWFRPLPHHRPLPKFNVHDDLDTLLAMQKAIDEAKNPTRYKIFDGPMPSPGEQTKRERLRGAIELKKLKHILASLEDDDEQS